MPWKAQGSKTSSSFAESVADALADKLETRRQLLEHAGTVLEPQTLADPAAVKPVTPYLYHYVVEALIRIGAKREARALLEKYWGAMVEAGADTFWEIFDPEKPLSSPYGDIHINSYCHAWSCTPSWLLRL